MKFSRIARYQQPRKLGRERGASMVEFAIVAPVLFLIVFGIVDFGWMFAQHQDVRHGAREGARLAAVNYNDTTNGLTQTQDIQQAVCDRTKSLPNATTRVKITLIDGPDPGTTPNDIGDRVLINVESPSKSLTGFFDFLKFNLHSSVEMRLEQTATFAPDPTGSYKCV